MIQKINWTLRVKCSQQHFKNCFLIENTSRNKKWSKYSEFQKHTKKERVKYAKNTYMQRCNYDFYGRRFFVSDAILWNSLPNYIRDTNSSETFKEKLKNHYLTLNIYFIFWDLNKLLLLFSPCIDHLKNVLIVF